MESLQCYIILYPTPKNTCLHFLSNFYWNRRNVLKNQIDKQQFASVFTNTNDIRKRKLNVRLIVVMCHSRQHFVVYLKPQCHLYAISFNVTSSNFSLHITFIQFIKENKKLLKNIILDLHKILDALYLLSALVCKLPLIMYY